MKKMAALLMTIMLFLTVSVHAEPTSADFLTAWPDYALEDQLIIPDTPNGDYAFLIIRNAQQRMLIGLHREETQWVQFIASPNPVPQGSLPARFTPIPAGDYWRLWDDTGDYVYTADGLGFAIYTSDGTMHHEGVEFSWNEGGFQLVSYQYAPGRYVDLMDDLFIFYTIINGFEESAAAPFVADLDWIHFAALPHSAGELQ